MDVDLVLEFRNDGFSQPSLAINGQEMEALDFGSSILFGSQLKMDENEIDPFVKSASAGKSAKLLNGKTIKLKPRKKKLEDDTIISGSFINMDKLFSKAELRNNIKKSSEQLDYFKPTTTQNNQIWAEKYRPQNFIDLCSAGNDKQYRSIFQWLKRWSGCVHKEKYVSDNVIDSLGRPHRKILLVHGPSGLGKTAAVHISAKQFGYSVQELNAANSMDQMPQSTNEPGSTTAALKLKILNALTSNSITSNGKPSCLVIDEIDSSFNARDIIKVLNDLAFDDKIGSRNFNNSEDPILKNKKSSKQKKRFIFNRPIICIANDLYGNNTGKFGPSPMDKLRPLCEVIAFRKPVTTNNKTGRYSGNSVASIKDHLLRICKKEGLDLDLRQICEIVEVCEGDLRACLNHLQFSGRTLLKSGNEDVNSSKDRQLSWYSIVDLLFKRDSQLSKDENFEQLLQLLLNGNGKSVVGSTNSLDKVLKGCFNKYLDVVHSQDDSLTKPAILSDWLDVYERFSDSSNGVSQYASLTTLKIWSLFGELNSRKNADLKPLIENAKALEFETNESMRANKTIIKSIIDKIPIAVKLIIGNNVDAYSCYFLPYLHKFFDPELSSKTFSGLRESERSTIQKLSVLLKAFNLTLESELDVQTGITTLEISPKWDGITIFDTEFTSTNIASLSKQIQQARQKLFPLLIAEAEKLSIKKSLPKRLTEASLINDEKKKRLKLGSSVEFFKQKYEGLSGNKGASITTDASIQSSKDSRIWVKYNEGFSNAVRKTIGWDDIWLA